MLGYGMPHRTPSGISPASSCSCSVHQNRLRHARPKAGQVSTVVRVDLDHAAISYLAGRSQGGGRSRARGPAIAMRSQQRPRFGEYDISHNVYYVQSAPARVSRHTSYHVPASTRPSGHACEGRQLLPEDLACVRAGSASATHDSAATRPWRCAAAPSRCSIAALRSRPCRQRPTALPPRCRKPACAQSRSTVLVCLGDAPHLGSTPARCPCSSGARADRCAAGN